MLISLQWLKDYIDIDVSIDELTHQMTMLGLEIESVKSLGEEITEVYTGKILSIDPHPDADKLVVCKTDIGREEPLQIVCGAKNMKAGDVVPTVIVGGTLPGGFKIGRRKMRGIESQGMMCSTNELGLGETVDGLMILDADTPIGVDAKELLGLDDVVLEIEVIPNRGDWASMIGVARELAALYDTGYRIPEITLTETQPAASTLSSVTIKAPDLCPRYIGRILQNVQVGPSPDWLCKRLTAAGQRPINNIVDITNYVLLETGHPLHAFDYEKLAENRIVVRQAKPGEKIMTLDDEERVLTEDMLVIGDAKDAQAVAGVMGGADSEVGEGTTTIFLESAWFKPASVRKTSRQLNLISEASQHFQRGADPEMAVYAINRAAQLMQELAGASICEGLLDEYPAPITFPEVSLDYARCHALMGVEIAPDTQRKYLEQLGFVITAQDDSAFTVQVPTWRHDVTMDADLIEEIARLYSYDNIPSTLPKIPKTEEVFAPQDTAIRALRRYLASLGLTELYNWTFSCVEDIENAGMTEVCTDIVALENPLSERQALMRPSLIPGILKNAAYNAHHGTLNIAAFEIGPVFASIEGEELAREDWHLAVVLAGVRDAAHWSDTAEAVDFYDIKGFAESILAAQGVNGKFEGVDYPCLQNGQSAQIMRRKQLLGHCGKVKHSVCKAFDLEHDLYMLNLNLSALLTKDMTVTSFKPIPAFPPAHRDIAVVVDMDAPAGDLLKTANEFGGKLLQRVEIFDIYEGNQVPEGKKSVALNLVFQSDERTLTDKDTEKALGKILKQLERNQGATLR